MQLRHIEKTFDYTINFNFSIYGSSASTPFLTWIEVSSDIVGRNVPSLGVLVSDTLLPVGQVSVVPV